MANNYKVVMGDIGSNLSEKFYSNLKRSVKIEKGGIMNGEIQFSIYKLSKELIIKN